MENKALNTENLEAASGGQIFSCGWIIGEQVSITSGSPLCPDCGEQLSSAGYYSERGYDAYKCKCGKYYVHIYVGNSWHRAYLVP